MTKNSFKQNDILSQSGTKNTKIFFIIFGEIAVLKKLKIKGV